MTQGNSIKVSIICTCYNHEKYIRDTLEGFIRQKTNFDFEVIVHDDASTDNSREIIQEYANRFPKVIRPIFQTVNQYTMGVKITQTYILPAIRGDYVAICEGDDYWIDETKVQVQFDYLESNPEYSACVHNSYVKDESIGTVKKQYLSKGDHDISTADVLPYGGACYHTSSLFFRKEYLYNRPSFFDGLSFDDYPQAIFLTCMGKVRFIDKPMSVYRFGTQGSWTLRNTHDTERLIVIREQIITMLRGVDEYTDGVYHEKIENIILNNQYCIQELKGNYQNLKQMPFLQIYEQKKYSYKVKLFFRMYFPSVYSFCTKKVMCIKNKIKSVIRIANQRGGN